MNIAFSCLLFLILLTPTVSNSANWKITDQLDGATTTFVGAGPNQSLIWNEVTQESSCFYLRNDRQRKIKLACNTIPADCYDINTVVSGDVFGLYGWCRQNGEMSFTEIFVFNSEGKIERTIKVPDESYITPQGKLIKKLEKLPVEVCSLDGNCTKTSLTNFRWMWDAEAILQLQNQHLFAYKPETRSEVSNVKLPSWCKKIEIDFNPSGSLLLISCTGWKTIGNTTSHKSAYAIVNVATKKVTWLKLDESNGYIGRDKFLTDDLVVLHELLQIHLVFVKEKGIEVRRLDELRSWHPRQVDISSNKNIVAFHGFGAILYDLKTKQISNTPYYYIGSWLKPIIGTDDFLTCGGNFHRVSFTDETKLPMACYDFDYELGDLLYASTETQTNVFDTKEMRSFTLKPKAEEVKIISPNQIFYRWVDSNKLEKITVLEKR